MSQNELTIEQATQRLQELNFLSNHHDSLAKHYLREGFALETNIIKAHTEQQTVTPTELAKEGRPPAKLVEAVEKAIELVDQKEVK